MLHERRGHDQLSLVPQGTASVCGPGAAMSDASWDLKNRHFRWRLRARELFSQRRRSRQRGGPKRGKHQSAEDDKEHASGKNPLLHVSTFGPTSWRKRRCLDG
jgi:hypothetical protein